MNPQTLSYSIETYRHTHDAALRDLLTRLDAWFEHNAWDAIAPQLGPDTTLLAVTPDGSVVGFVVVRLEDDTVGRVTWAGVDPAQQRQGIGRDLFDHIAAEARAAGLTQLRVETISDTVDYAPFQRTRAFYQSLGFIPAVELGDRAQNGLATTDWSLDLLAAV